MAGIADRIEKQIELNAPVSRVWEALTDYKQFGEWFRVDLEQPFAVGQFTQGKILYPGCEHLLFTVRVEAMEPERRFVISGNPCAEEPGKASPDGPRTVVEFTLAPTDKGTLLSIVESGFHSVPHDKRGEVYRGNEEGWEIQMKNIAAYLKSQG